MMAQTKRRTTLTDTPEGGNERHKRRAHGEGALFLRSDGLWVGRLMLPDGTRKTYYGKTQKEAAGKLNEAKRQLEDGVDLSAEKLTVKAYLDKWLSASVKPSVKTKTFEGYESICRVRVAPRIGSKKLAKLTALDLQALYSDLATAGLSARSVHHTHRVLHRAFVQAVRWRLIPRNPCDGAQGPRATRSEMKVWTPEEADAFLLATRDHRMHALYVLALTTGMRQGELLGLKWGDLDVNAGVLAVRRSLQWQRGNGYAFVEPKTARSRRKIHLSQMALAALRAHKDRQAWSRREAGEAWTETDLVFCDPLGGPLAPSHQTGVFKAASAAAGLPAIRFHDMRHTAATILLIRGIHVKLVSEMLGHSTIVLTLDTYSHLIPAMHGDAAAVMDAVFTA
jgi:integrase